MRHVQVASIKTPSLYTLAACATLRHLTLETDMRTKLLSKASFRDFDQLESLTLCDNSPYLLSGFRTVDVAHLSKLKELRIEAFAPTRISVAEGCTVHAVWDK